MGIGSELVDGLGLGEGIGVPEENSLLQKPPEDFGVGVGDGLEDSSGVGSGVVSGLGLGVGDGVAVFKSNF